jgi:hypothetical protein
MELLLLPTDAGSDSGVRVALCELEELPTGSAGCGSVMTAWELLLLPTGCISVRERAFASVDPLSNDSCTRSTKSAVRPTISKRRINRVYSFIII